MSVSRKVEDAYSVVESFMDDEINDFEEAEFLSQLIEMLDDKLADLDEDEELR